MYAKLQRHPYLGLLHVTRRFEITASLYLHITTIYNRLTTAASKPRRLFCRGLFLGPVEEVLDE